MFNITVNIVIFNGYVLKVMCKTGQNVCVDLFFQVRVAALLQPTLRLVLYITYSK